MKCKLCEAIKNEKPIYFTKNYIILPTKNLKGHHKRIMILPKAHISKLSKEEERYVNGLFKSFCKKYFDEEPTYVIVDSTYATIPEHWHRIACDWFCNNEELLQLHYTPHICIKTNIKWRKK